MQVIWHDNILTGNGYNGYTAVFLNNASPYLYKNHITDNYHGILLSSSNASFAAPPNEDPEMLGYNAITCVGSDLFKAENYSTIYMGYDYDGGYNSIFGSDLPDMQSLNHSGVYADNNYWGPYSPAVYADGTSWILSRTPLSTDPNPGFSCSISKTSSPLAKSFTEPSTDISKKYWQAISDGQKGDFSSAKNILKSIITGSYDNKYSPLALLAFYSLKLKQNNLKNPDNSLKQDFESTLNNLYSSSKNSIRPFAIRLLAREAALSNDTTNMLRYNREIVNSYPNSDNELSALFDLTMYYSEIGNSLTKAKQYFSRMKKAYPKEDLTKLAELNLGDKIDIKSLENKKLTSEVSDNFMLDEAYPNPFNPSTTISYQIPKEGFVTLKIYDELGREIKTLVNKFETKGKHNAKFNAENLASGIYFYQLTIYNRQLTNISFSSTKKIILLR